VPYAAAERNLLPYLDNYVSDFPYVTANVNLWPQTVALIANPDSLSRLTSEQRGWIEAAAQDATTRSIELIDHDQDLVADTCAKGARYAIASEADLAALRQAFAPAYADLEQDAQTQAFIDEIEAMKSEMPAPTALQIPADCDAATAEPAADDPLLGSWQTDALTEGQIVHAFVAAGGTEAAGHEFFAQFGTGATESVVFTLEFDNGGVTQFESGDGGPTVQGSGAAYTLDGEVLTLDFEGCITTLSVDLRADTLRLRFTSASGSSCVPEEAPYGATIYTSFPFTRVP
jgi:hypothetical protein